MVYGIGDKTAEFFGVERNQVNTIVERLSNLTRDTIDPKIKMDHSVERYHDKELLIVHIKESAVKPVQLAGKTMEEVYIRNGGTTRKASKHEIGSLMLNKPVPTDIEELFHWMHAEKMIDPFESDG